MMMSSAVPSPVSHLSTNARDTVKLLTLGDSGSGKTSLLNRYCEDNFQGEYMATIGVDFKVKRLFINDELVRVQIWDTAGQERFRTITRNYYAGAHGVLFVYAVDNRTSQENVHGWITDILDTRGQGDGGVFDCVLVANKMDLLTGQAKRIREETQAAENIAGAFGMKAFMTSAKENTGVSEAFEGLIRTVYFKKKKEDATFAQREADRILMQSYNRRGDDLRKQSRCCVVL